MLRFFEMEAQVTRKVLLADDVKLFLELEKAFFRRRGIEFLVACTGREALELTREHRPGLVLMDLYMPEMNGDEACRQLKSDPGTAAIPVVMVTQGDSEEQLACCRSAGCDDILLKPLNGRAMEQMVGRYLHLQPRREVRFKVRLKVLHGPEPQNLLADYTVNLSSGGLFLETSRPLPLDTPLTLAFTLPGREQPLRCRGRVAWVNLPEMMSKPDLPAGMGLQFTDLALDDLRALRAFLVSQGVQPCWKQER